GGQPAPPPQGAPFTVFLQSLELSNGAFNFTAKDASAPMALALDKVHVALGKFATGKQAPPVSFEAQARLGTGALALKGALDLAHSQLATEVSLDKIDLRPWQTLAQPFWAGTITSGTLGAHAKLKTTFIAGHFNVLAETASAALNTVELQSPTAGEKPVQLGRISVAIEQIDLAKRQAIIKEVRGDGLHLFARRGSDGQLNLAAFLRTSPRAPAAADHGSPVPAGTAAAPPRIEPQRQAVMSLPGSIPHPGPAASAGGSQWQYRIESVALENTDASVEDDTGPQPITQEIAPLNLHLKDVSGDLGKPFGLQVDGALKPAASFKIDGTAVLVPLKASLRVLTKRIDLTPADRYVSGLLNARITRAVLSTDGALELAIAQDKFRASYRGGATLGNLRMIDKVTNEKFFRCGALTAVGIDAEVGGDQPSFHVGEVALSDFYTRLILNSNGKLNLRDLVASPQTAPTSLTRAKPSGEAPPAPSALPTPAPSASTSSGPPVDIKLGRIALQGGNIDFTDNFIKPHYSAKLTEVAGKIGSVGTRSTKPAEVELQGQVNASAPIDITGSLNPLAPQAYVDLKAKADGVELSNLTPYSTKYTGYPITRGTLTVDVHYLLENGKLSANNHFFIDQLTFGDRVESPNAINLPIALAVSLLKNSRGEIDVTIPVSGALSDPQFSIGALIFQAFSNLILKVVSSPFTMLASLAGASNQQLDFVEFAPGLATLNPESEKRLATLSQALKDRPALRLGISGRVDPRVDRDGLRAAMVQRAIKTQKVKELRDRGEIADVDSVQLAPDEYDKYLLQAYKKAKFTKPTNVLGLAKSLPPEEMKKLMLVNTEVTDEDLRELAGARAVTVRRWLSKQVDPVRLAVVAPRFNADGIKDKGKTTRVDLSIQ
ncbi:MAG TPA: DUF748 domain-containing protein, partial [Candidatus Binataceae bacterium]|nr:DUF748 domain-containing protein [Candidatus Binataceae bacterium]